MSENETIQRFEREDKKNKWVGKGNSEIFENLKVTKCEKVRETVGVSDKFIRENRHFLG